MKTKNKKHIKHASESKELTFPKLIKSCLISTLLFCIVGALISFILALLFYRTNDPTNMLRLSGIIAVFLSVLISSFALSKRNGEKYIIGGFILGLMILCLISLISVFVPSNTNNYNLILKCLIPLVAILGSSLGIKRNKKKRNHKFR